MDKATPRPWATDGKWSDYIEGVRISAPNYAPSVAIARYVGGTAAAKANAALIVKAVNAHDELMALTRKCFLAYENGGEDECVVAAVEMAEWYKSHVIA